MERLAASEKRKKWFIWQQRTFGGIRGEKRDEQERNEHI